MKSRGVRAKNRQRCLLDALESRELLSAWGSTPKTLSLKSPAKNKGALAHSTLEVLSRAHGAASPYTASPPGNAYTPAQIRHAYGIDSVMFGDIIGDGTGQTIALIEAYDYAAAFADLQVFDAQFGLPDPPSFRRVNQTGGTSTYPSALDSVNNPSYGWQLEAALDIQWAHAMAPGANLILVECNSPYMNDMIGTGVNWARSQPGVSVVSMSFGSGEYGAESDYDNTLTTPVGHTGVTFVTSAGDTGQPAGYPAYSPNVVSVGGTSLYLNGNDYAGEAGWGLGGGGISAWEPKPAYQAAVTLSGTRRMAPDVALDADPYTGVAVYISLTVGWRQVGGTSLAAPLFAGILAVADQGRTWAGVGPMDGATQTLPKLYAAPAAAFHDVTSGNNGSPATAGYDLVTGLGSPVANILINSFVPVVGSLNGHAYSDNNGDGLFDDGDTALAGVTIYADNNNNGQLDVGGTQTKSSARLNLVIPDNSTTGASSSISIANLGSGISSLSVALNITHTRDGQLSAYLIGPDGTRIKLFSGVGGNAANFAGTTFVDSAAQAITAGAAPFAGSYRPTNALSAFNGQSANGSWTLLLTDTAAFNAGFLSSWSISVTTYSDPSTVTAANGAYVLAPLATGSYALRAATPANFVDTTQPHANYNVNGGVAGADFMFLPTAFATSSPNDSFYLWLNGGTLNISKSGTATNPAYQLPLAKVPGLTFHLTAGAKLVVDYSAGDPVPAGNIQIDGGDGISSELQIVGSAVPLLFSDTQVRQTGGGALVYSHLGGITFLNSVVSFQGTLQSLQFVNLDAGTVFYWG